MQAQKCKLSSKPSTKLLIAILFAVTFGLAGCQSDTETSSTSPFDQEEESAQTNPQPDDTGGDDGQTEGSNTVTISWVAPSQRTDGTPMSLSQIGGYEVHYGTESGDYTQVKRVSDGTATEAEIADLANGEYFFAVRVFDSQGLTSGYSEEQSVTIN